MPDRHAGDKDDWDIEFGVDLAESLGIDDRLITPDSGKVRISYVDDNGDRRYWNGGAFVVGAPITLNTTIVGKRSRYGYTHQVETVGRVVTMQGWITKNGADTPVATTLTKVLEADIRGDFGG